MGYNIIEDIKSNDNILFGPFLGEFNWELLYWFEIIKKTSIEYPEKNIIVSTIKERMGLYLGLNVELSIINLDIGEEPIQNGYILNNINSETYKKLIHFLTSRYPNHFFIEPMKITNPYELCPFLKFDFTLDIPIKENSIVNHLIDKSQYKIPVNENEIDINKIKIPILIEPIYNNSWCEKHWIELIHLFLNEERYIILLSEISNTENKFPKINNESLHYLRDYKSEMLKTNELNLAIASINNCHFTISNTNSNLMSLSGIIGTPIITWGKNLKRCAVDLNPKSTKVFGITNSIYDVMSIFNKCQKIIKSKGKI